jgi:hypothetical protein
MSVFHGFRQVESLSRPLRKSLFLQSVILSGARRKVLFSQSGGPERSRRTSSLSPGMTETDSIRSKQSRSAALSRRHPAVRWTSAFRQRRSFDSGSATSFGQTHLLFAFAQDDGIFLRDGTFAEVSFRMAEIQPFLLCTIN